MKKILFIILFASLSVLAQTNWPTTKIDAYNGRGIYVSDSLYQAWVDTAATPDDTLTSKLAKTIALGFEYDTFVLELVDTGTVYDDSIYVELGIIDVSKTPQDTSWHNFPLRDSTWTVKNGILVDDNSRHIYSTYYPLPDVIRIWLKNAQVRTSRTHWFNVVAIKKEREN